MMIVAPVLTQVDDVSRRMSITRALNEELGTSIGPWAWDEWPVEFIETVMAYRMKDVPDDGD